MNTTAAAITTAAVHHDTSFFQPLENALTQLLVQIIVILSLAAFVAHALSYIKQPRVVSEIITGIILGPTVMGYIPNFTNTIFPTASLPIFNEVADLGLIYFMFIIGLEIDLELLKKNAKKAAFISLTGFITPFCVGLLLALFLINTHYIPDGANQIHFYLFLGVAVCITAFPVLARIISERNLLNTHLGLLILASAAVDDAMAWVVLALVIALVRAGTPINALYVLLTMLGFILFMIFVWKRLMYKLCNQYGPNNQRLFIFILICVMAASWFTEAIGVHAIFGAFVFGLVLPRSHHFTHDLTRKIEDFVVSCLLPLYFCKSGLSTQLGLLRTGQDWGSCILIIAGAFVGKIIPGIIAARICGLEWKECLVVGFLRNAKGLVELIVLNIGLNLGVISPQVFGMLVLMAVITTMSSTPLMYLVYPPRRILADDRLPPEKDAPLLVVLQNHENDFEMFAVSAAIRSKRKPVYVLRLHEVNDLPSSFMIRPEHPMEDQGVAQGEALPLTTQLQSAMLNVDIRVASVTTPWYSNPALEVVGVATQRHTRMVLLHQDQSDAFNLSLFSRSVLEAVLAESSTHVGIVISHGTLKVEPAPIKHAFFPYGGHPADTEVLRLLATLARVRGMTVTVMHPPNLPSVNHDALKLLQAARGIQLVAVENESLETAAIQFTINNEVDLCVIGTSAERAHLEEVSDTELSMASFTPRCQAKLVLVVYQVPEEIFQARVAADNHAAVLAQKEANKAAMSQASLEAAKRHSAPIGDSGTDVRAAPTQQDSPGPHGATGHMDHTADGTGLHGDASHQAPPQGLDESALMDVDAVHVRGGADAGDVDFQPVGFESSV